MMLIGKGALRLDQCAFFKCSFQKRRERMGYTKQDVIRLVQEEDVEFIRLQFTDMFEH